MATGVDPILEQWYSHLDKGQKFQVVAMDEDAHVVEIQYFDGAVDIVSEEDWEELDLDMIEPPANMAGPMDLANKEDMGYQTTDLEPGGVTPASEYAIETTPEEHVDDRQVPGGGNPREDTRNPIEELAGPHRR
jgi:hypothetical protein